MVLTPGNNASQPITNTYGYMQDGNSSQSEELGLPITMTDNLGHVFHYRYDERGNKIAMIDPLLNETDFQWTLANLPSETIYPATAENGAGRDTTVYNYLYSGGPLMVMYHYDEGGNMIRRVNFSYGPEGEEISRTGSVESDYKTYDAIYRLNSTSDGNGNTTKYTYNQAGYLSGMIYPGGDTIQYPSYDAAGDCLQRIDGRGVVTNYIYNDPCHKLTDVQYPAFTGLNNHYNYDKYGRITSLTDSTGTSAYAYDDGDRRIVMTRQYIGLPIKTFTYDYYPDGSREDMTTPGGTFSYTYDAGQKLIGMSAPDGQTSWTYLNNNWLWAQKMANGVSTIYTYNSECLPTEIKNISPTGAVLSDYNAIQYDGDTNETSVTSTIPTVPSLSGQTNFTFDNENQLKLESSTTEGGYTNNFTYDSAQNATTFKGVLNNFNANNQNTSNTYDGAGNPITYRGIPITYDAEQRITSVGTSLTAGYDMLGRRAWKQAATGRTYFLYDGIQPVCEMDSNGNVTAVNIFGVNGLISRVVNDVPTYYTFDEQGNTAQILDNHANIVNTFHYSAFGTSTSSSGSPNVFGYHGQLGYYTDLETGLCLLTYRYYDPATGCFLNRDPIGYSGGENLYSYVHNRPNRLTDIEGHAPSPICLVPCIPCLSCAIDLGIVCSDCGTDAARWGNCITGTWGNLPPWTKWLCGGACAGCLICLATPKPTIPPIVPPFEPPNVGPPASPPTLGPDNPSNPNEPPDDDDCPPATNYEDCLASAMLICKTRGTFTPECISFEVTLCMMGMPHNGLQHREPYD